MRSCAQLQREQLGLAWVDLIQTDIGTIGMAIRSQLELTLMCRVMSAIKPAVRHRVPEILESIADVELGEPEPDSVVEWRRMMAMGVLASVVNDDQENLEPGDMAVTELAGAIMVLREKPRDQAVVDALVSARDIYREFSARR